MRWLRRCEVLAWLSGTLLSTFFVVQLAHGELDRRLGIQLFAQNDFRSAVDFDFAQQPDTRLWAPARITRYRASADAQLPEVLGILEIPALALKVPVYAGNDDVVLDRGAGIISGMAYPHEQGNIGISGHRDGYFRVLKNIAVGDDLLLQTLAGNKHFVVDSLQVVDKDDTALLQDTDEQTVTLVTCYPFYFVGNAPRRFVVTARRQPKMTLHN